MTVLYAAYQLIGLTFVPLFLSGGVRKYLFSGCGFWEGLFNGFSAGIFCAYLWPVLIIWFMRNEQKLKRFQDACHD